MSNSTGSSGQLFIIAAPSGGGKTSLVRELLKNDPRLVLSVSHTTREPRPGEEQSGQYHFVALAAFKEMVDQGEFMEHATVFGNMYGTNRQTVARQLEQNHDVILEIDWQGARQVRKDFPDCCSIFILPPSLETLETRLTERGQDSAEVIQRRMNEARDEIAHWSEFTHLIVNNNFQTAVEDLASIINDHRNGQQRVANKDYQILAQSLGTS